MIFSPRVVAVVHAFGAHDDARIGLELAVRRERHPVLIERGRLGVLAGLKREVGMTHAESPAKAADRTYMIRPVALRFAVAAATVQAAMTCRDTSLSEKGALPRHRAHHKPAGPAKNARFCCAAFRFDAQIRRRRPISRAGTAYAAYKGRCGSCGHRGMSSLDESFRGVSVARRKAGQRPVDSARSVAGRRRCREAASDPTTTATPPFGLPRVAVARQDGISLLR